jgi:hypothetical protein
MTEEQPTPQITDEVIESLKRQLAKAIVDFDHALEGGLVVGRLDEIGMRVQMIAFALEQAEKLEKATASKAAKQAGGVVMSGVAKRRRS